MPLPPGGGTCPTMMSVVSAAIPMIALAPSASTPATIVPSVRRPAYITVIPANELSARRMQSLFPHGTHFHVAVAWSELMQDSIASSRGCVKRAPRKSAPCADSVCAFDYP